jgi:diguanylate cyclase (GGDEF)-like protein
MMEIKNNNLTPEEVQRSIENGKKFVESKKGETDFEERINFWTNWSRLLREFWTKGLLSDHEYDETLGIAKAISEHYSEIDSLTEVNNRRGFDRRAEAEIDRVGRQDDPKLCLILGDLNNFKLLNDERGHETGDLFLELIAKGLRLRSYDIVGRIGGDEFKILLPDTDEETALIILKRLKQVTELLSQDPRFSGTSKPVGIALGLAQWHKGESLKELSERVDKLMYKDKKTSKNG